jgi:hypothetical protein
VSDPLGSNTPGALVTEVPSLRDYFAAAALQGVLAQYSSTRPPDVQAIALEAYRYADAMLEVRSKE